MPYRSQRRQRRKASETVKIGVDESQLLQVDKFIREDAIKRALTTFIIKHQRRYLSDNTQGRKQARKEGKVSEQK